MFLSVVFIIAIVIGIILILTVFRERLALDDKALHKQKLAYVAVGFPCMVALTIICFSNYGRLDIFDAQAQSEFLSLAKLPLIIVGLSTVLIGIVVNAHRTIQTSKQIEVATTKNKADLFISHYKMCLDNIMHIENSLEMNLSKTKFSASTDIKRFGDKLTVSLTFKHKKPNLLYNKFYPRNNLLSGAVDLTPKDITKDIEDNIITFMESITKRSKLVEFGKVINDRLDNPEKHLKLAGGLDCSDYIELNRIVSYNGAERNISVTDALRLFYSMVSSYLDSMFFYHQVSTRIEYPNGSENISMFSFLLDGLYGYKIHHLILPRLISICLNHLVDLQYSMGAISDDARVRLCIIDLESCMYQLNTINKPDD